MTFKKMPYTHFHYPPQFFNNKNFYSKTLKKMDTNRKVLNNIELTAPKEISIENKTDNIHSKRNNIELFGIKLEIDDLLIIGILFFLYSENVKDEILYVVLIILLLS